MHKRLERLSQGKGNATDQSMHDRAATELQALSKFLKESVSSAASSKTTTRATSRTGSPEHKLQLGLIGKLAGVDESLQHDIPNMSQLDDLRVQSTSPRQIDVLEDGPWECGDLRMDENFALAKPVHAEQNTVVKTTELSPKTIQKAQAALHTFVEDIERKQSEKRKLVSQVVQEVLQNFDSDSDTDPLPALVSNCERGGESFRKQASTASGTSVRSGITVGESAPVKGVLIEIDTSDLRNAKNNSDTNAKVVRAAIASTCLPGDKYKVQREEIAKAIATSGCERFLILISSVHQFRGVYASKTGLSPSFRRIYSIGTAPLDICDSMVDKRFSYSTRGFTEQMPGKGLASVDAVILRS